jgi:hypothetical protein
MLRVTEPALSVAAAEVYPPPVTVTVPVGAGAPLPPLTTTVTVNPWAVAMLEEDGVTVTMGVTSATVTAGDVPVMPL